MTGGMHIAGRAMANYAARHDVISNNLANVSTPGFARQDTFVELLNEPGGAALAVPQLGTHTDFTPGIPMQTGNHLDLSLEGSGFFTLLTDQGHRFSRVAPLQIDAEGFLRTTDGDAVLGENGVLYIGDGWSERDDQAAKIYIEKDGSVFLNDTILDRLLLTTFASGDDVVREPGGLYALREGRRPVETMVPPIVHSGQIEGSSVQPVGELIQVIQAMRAYDAAASALRATDKTVDRAVNDIARI
jgi:flagellar basal-body rod protein FlgG